MRINTPLNDNDYRELKKESKEVLGASGYLNPPFGQSTDDYVEVHLLDTDGNFLEKFNSIHTTFEDDTIILNIGQDLRDRDYNRGEFQVRYHFVRKVAGGDDIVLTKTVSGQPNIIHSGNPALTGVPMGQFHTDSEGNAFVGENPPANGQDAQPLDIKEWKFKIDEISPSRTEVRIVPQLISNSNYIKEFRELIEPRRYIPETAWTEYIDGDGGLLNAWRTIRDNPDDGLSKWWRPRLQFEDNVTKKSDFGKLHWNLFGQNEPNRNLPTQDGGGQISWTGPDSSRLEFNVRREVEDEGFKDFMIGSTITIKKAYVVGYETRPDTQENSEYSAEDGIPELYIQVVNVPDTKQVNFTMYTKDGEEFDPNTNGVQFYWEFGCGHVKEASKDSTASHNYDTEGSYAPTVYVMTPNFQDEVTEIRTPSGRVLDFVELGESTSTDETDTTTEAGESQLDGRIIKWEGDGGTPITNLSGGQSTTNTRWFVQNGYRRWITNGENLQILRDALNIQQKVNVEGAPIPGSYIPTDIELEGSTINSLPIGPDLNALSFTQGPSTTEQLPTEDMGEPVFLGFWPMEEVEETSDDETEGDDDSGDDSNSDGTAFTIKLFNSPIVTTGPLSERTAGSFVKFGNPQPTGYENTNDAVFLQQNFVTSQNINIKAKPMGADGVNIFVGFFDDPDFTQPSFSPQPDADEAQQVFVNGNRNFYVKVQSDF